MLIVWIIFVRRPKPFLDIHPTGLGITFLNEQELS